MGGAMMMGNFKATQFKVFVESNWDRPQRKGGYNTPPLSAVPDVQGP